MRRKPRRQSGTTVVEVAISGALLVGMMIVGVPVFNSIGTACDGGAAQLSAQSQNARALMRMQGELLNTSSDALDDYGTPRLVIADGVAPAPQSPARGTAKTVGLTEVAGVSAAGQIASEIRAGLGLVPGSGPPTDPGAPGQPGKGSGSQGGTHGGREREVGGAAGIAGVSARPRQTPILLNSILTFQKVADYEAVDGAPVVRWSSPITYQVADRKLVRIQDGETEVVANHVLALNVQRSDLGTIRVTLVTEKQAGTSGAIHRSANAVEVSPKN